MNRVIIFILLFSVIISSAQTIVKTAEYSLNIPKGWKYQKDGNVVIVGNDHVRGIIIVYPHNFQNIKVLKSNMKKGIAEDGLYLQLVSSIQKKGKNSVWGEYTGFYNMQAVKAKAYGILSSYGGGTVIISMSTSNRFSKKLVDTSDIIAQSLHYVKQRKSSPSLNKKSNKELMQQFVGEWVTMTKYSESHIYLYPNGTYIYNSESSYANSDTSVGTIWGTAQDSQNRGYWKVHGNLRKGEIIMRDPNGEIFKYPYSVHIEDDQIYYNEYYFGEKLYFKK